MNMLLGLLVAALLPVFFDRLFPETAARLGLALERRYSGLRRYSAIANGFAMPFLDGGKGEPLLLIHGFAGDKDNFCRIARFLTPHYRVIIPDLPGFGEASRDLNANYSMADQVANVCAFMDQLGLQQVHLGGNSMGGFIASQLAATYPDRVASLWLLDAAGTQAAHDSDMLQEYLVTDDVPLLVRSEQDFKTLLQAATYKTPFMPYSIKKTYARRAVTDYPLHTKIMAQLTASPLLEAQFSIISTPALIVWGQEDRMLSPDGAWALHTLLPKSQVRMMPGVGHMPMLETPRQVAMDYIHYRQTVDLATKS
ncbi:alpha/beta fold hydrolase [Porticoccus sp.]